MSKKLFPIRTATSCQLKWSWSALFLNTGESATCHRTSNSKLTSENFNNFHNTGIVLEDRRKMLNGEWPESNCSYCKNIEDNGGTSDRIRMLDIPNLYPDDLDNNPNSVVVDPTVVEVFFSNLCNLGCLYCKPGLSSSINTENKKFGIFKSNGVELTDIKSQYSNLIKDFWKWFPIGFPKLKRFHVLGGEPILQKEFETLLEYIDQNPNPGCILNIVTNLSYPTERLEFFIKKFKKLLIGKKIKRIDITCSIDCWGPAQEYTRYGIDLQQWENNFQTLLQNKFLYLNINQTVSVLTIKDMPMLLEKLENWRQHHPVQQFFSGVTPGPSYMKADILPGKVWKTDFETILSLMPQDTEQNKEAWNYMQGISKSFLNGQGKPVEVSKLITYLNEKDRRRGTNWQQTFPWLKDHVV